VTPKELATKWRADAELLDIYDQNLARVCRQHAEALDAALRSVDDDALDLATAAKESGYSVERLRHLVSDQTIPNAGRKGAPRVRRGDLPNKRKPMTGFDAKAAARAVLHVERAS
jgi:hypothetical protein